MRTKPTLKEWMQAGQTEFVFDPAKHRERTLDRLYSTGMGLADCLRLLGEHKKSNEVEVWVIDFCRRSRDDN